MNRFRVASAISIAGLALAAGGFILAVALTTAAHIGWAMIGVGIFVNRRVSNGRDAAAESRRGWEGRRADTSRYCRVRGAGAHRNVVGPAYFVTGRTNNEMK